LIKKILLLLLITFSLESWAKTDDIRDFEIEGISIGDSLLDHFTLEEIKKNLYIYKDSNKKFTATNLRSTSKNYKYIQVHYKTNDKKFIVYTIDGVFAVNKKTSVCNKKRKNINDSISAMFKNLEREDGNDLEMVSGRGTMDRTKYLFDNNDFIEVVCYKYNVSTHENNGRLGVVKKELDDWIISLK
jgi:hypothetical protein